MNNKKRRRDKRGQLKLSFGMIFSIILIIVFLAFAFFAVQKFLGLGDSAQITKFRNDLQSDIDKIWQTTQGSQQEEYFLPSEIRYVCFTDYSSEKQGQYQDFHDELNQVYYGAENMFFYPVGSAGGLDSTEMKHVALGDIIKNENPYCIQNIDGKIKLTLKKNFGEVLVSVLK